MLKPIKNSLQYENALARAYALMQKNIKPDAKEEIKSGYDSQVGRETAYSRRGLDPGVLITNKQKDPN